VTITEAAKHYGVSRSKLHRLIREGKLQAHASPKDARASFLATADLDRVLGTGLYEQGEGTTGRIMEAHVAQRYRTGTGYLTDELMARMDAFRERLSRGGRVSSDSVKIIQKEREKRTRELMRRSRGE